jgi:hypothetical protein
MSFRCSLCGLEVEVIPETSIRVGKLSRFEDGSHHLFRKVMAPRTALRPRKRNPDQQESMVWAVLGTQNKKLRRRNE